jgi:hypothetical protein
MKPACRRLSVTARHSNIECILAATGASAAATKKAAAAFVSVEPVSQALSAAVFASEEIFETRRPRVPADGRIGDRFTGASHERL